MFFSDENRLKYITAQWNTKNRRESNILSYFAAKTTDIVKKKTKTILDLIIKKWAVFVVLFI